MLIPSRLRAFIIAALFLGLLAPRGWTADLSVSGGLDVAIDALSQGRQAAGSLPAELATPVSVAIGVTEGFFVGLQTAQSIGGSTLGFGGDAGEVFEAAEIFWDFGNLIYNN